MAGALRFHDYPPEKQVRRRNTWDDVRDPLAAPLRDVRQYIGQILIVVCDRTTPAALAVVGRLQTDLGELIEVHRQQLPYLGGALREAFDLARGTHVVLMASDLETDPNLLRK